MRKKLLLASVFIISVFIGYSYTESKVKKDKFILKAERSGIGLWIMHKEDRTACPNNWIAGNGWFVEGSEYERANACYFTGFPNGDFHVDALESGEQLEIPTELLTWSKSRN